MLTKPTLIKCMASVLMLLATVNAPSEAVAQIEPSMTRAQKDAATRSAVRSIRQHERQSTTGGMAARGPRIIRGDDVRTADAFWAWTVSLRLLADANDQGGFTHWCGGALISPIKSGGMITGWRGDDNRPQWVLTAAHCFFDPSSGDRLPNTRLKVRSGAVDLVDLDRITIDKVFIHPDYDDNTILNDIALIKINRPSAPTGNKKRTSIRLPRRSETGILYAPYAAMNVFGWGRTESGPFSSRLQHLRAPYVSTGECGRAYSGGGGNNPIKAGMICAGYSTGAYDSCSGDSGGPMAYLPTGAFDELITDPVLIGVVSWGRGCAKPGFYGVYSSVNAFMDWIERTVQAN